MGCDIHGWVEVNHNGKYIAVSSLKSRDRNYERFAALAGVRDCEGTSKAVPLGIPDDVSDTAKYDIEQWSPDGHSHSFMPLKEAAKIFLDTHFGEVSEYMKDHPESYFFDYEEDDIDKARLVFWFDN